MTPLPRFILLTVLAAALGCGSNDALRPGPETQPHPGLTTRSVPVDIDLIERALPETIRLMHWGQARIVNDITALHASAVDDRDRVVDIRARKEKGGVIAVQVRVGHYGDAEMEKAFHALLDEQIEFQKNKLARKQAAYEGR